MVSVLVEDLPPATSDFLHRRARRTGAASVTEQVRHELITLAREQAPVDEVVRFVEQNYAHPPLPEIDPDATVLANAYRLPTDAWSTLCRRAAASHVAVSNYIYDELDRLSRHPTIDDAMWELGELKAADPSLDIDVEEAWVGMRHARGLDWSARVPRSASALSSGPTVLSAQRRRGGMTSATPCRAGQEQPDDLPTTRAAQV
jgi:hypothetical protein